MANMFIRLIGTEKDMDGNPMPASLPPGTFTFFVNGVTQDTQVQLRMLQEGGPQQSITNYTADANGEVDATDTIGPPQIRDTFVADFSRAVWNVPTPENQPGREGVLTDLRDGLRIEVNVVLA